MLFNMFKVRMYMSWFTNGILIIPKLLRCNFVSSFRFVQTVPGQIQVLSPLSPIGFLVNLISVHLFYFIHNRVIQPTVYINIGLYA